MATQVPLVSVIVPVFNAERFLGQALASVRNQRHRPLEIIVIDDGSTDGSADAIRAMQVCGDVGLITLCQTNQGPASARNRGLEAASGEFIAFLDADDLWPSGAIDGLLEQFTGDDGLDVVVGRTQRVHEVPDSGGGLRLETLGSLWMAFSLVAALFRRRMFDSVGTFDESMRYGEDVDWFLRAREAGARIGISKSVTRLYRIHENNMTRDHRTSDRYFLTALKKSLDRRRTNGGEASGLALVSGLGEIELETFDLKDAADE